jgi:hypothetical protein
MDGARPAGGHTDTYLAGELGMRTGHKGRHLLVPGLDEINLVLGAVESAHHSIDAVPGIAINAFDAPGDQSSYYKIADLLTHIDVFYCRKKYYAIDHFLTLHGQTDEDRFDKEKEIIQ